MLDREIIHCLAEITGFTVEALPAVLHYDEADGSELQIHIEADQELITLWCGQPCPTDAPMAEILLRVNAAWRDPSASWLYFDPHRQRPILVSALPRARTDSECFNNQAPLFFSACARMHDLLTQPQRL